LHYQWELLLAVGTSSGSGNTSLEVGKLHQKPSPTVESTSAEGQNKHSTTAKNGESTDSILSKPAIKFVKAGDRPAERPTTNKAKFVKAAEMQTTDKVETIKKPAVRYVEMYRRTSKRLESGTLAIEIFKFHTREVSDRGLVPQPPPPPAVARTMPQRMAMLDDDVHEIRGELGEQRERSVRQRTGEASTFTSQQDQQQPDP
nr:hypothetical protein [Tanacetum cinerariifolium]